MVAEAAAGRAAHTGSPKFALKRFELNPTKNGVAAGQTKVRIVKSSAGTSTSTQVGRIATSAKLPVDGEL